jgi:hypothetical protein
MIYQVTVTSIVCLDDDWCLLWSAHYDDKCECPSVMISQVSNLIKVGI